MDMKSTLLFNQKPDPEFNTIISIPSALLQRFIDEFMPWCEAEILSGQKQTFDDHTEFRFNLPEEKKKKLQEYIISGFTNNFNQINDN